jgi:hypothetical protein
MAYLSTPRAKKSHLKAICKIIKNLEKLVSSQPSNHSKELRLSDAAKILGLRTSDSKCNHSDLIIPGLLKLTNNIKKDEGTRMLVVNRTYKNKKQGTQKELYRNTQKNLIKVKKSIISLLMRKPRSCAEIRRALDFPNYRITWSILVQMEKDGIIVANRKIVGKRILRDKYELIVENPYKKLVFQSPLKNNRINKKMSIGMQRIISVLKKHSIKYNLEYVFKECVDKRQLPFDVYLPKYNALIEFDGRQHFHPVKLWGGDEQLLVTKNHDQIKNNFCEKKGIPLLRIPYTIDNTIKTEEKILNFVAVIIKS